MPLPNLTLGGDRPPAPLLARPLPFFRTPLVFACTCVPEVDSFTLLGESRIRVLLARVKSKLSSLIQPQEVPFLYDKTIHSHSLMVINFKRKYRTAALCCNVVTLKKCSASIANALQSGYHTYCQQKPTRGVQKTRGKGF